MNYDVKSRWAICLLGLLFSLLVVGAGNISENKQEIISISSAEQSEWVKLSRALLRSGSEQTELEWAVLAGRNPELFLKGSTSDFKKVAVDNVEF